jgi:hypothetical protein
MEVIILIIIFAYPLIFFLVQSVEADDEREAKAAEQAAREDLMRRLAEARKRNAELRNKKGE